MSGGFIIVDTEYTAWEDSLATNWGGLGQEKEIVQIAAIKVDEHFHEVSAFDQMVRPLINPTLSTFFKELTTISQERVDSEGVSFCDALVLFNDFTERGSLPVICMNADEMVFWRNCDLNNVAFPFSKPWHRVRPFAEQNGVDMKNNSSGTLHLHTDSPLETVGHTHYALHDVRSMACYLEYMKKTGVLENLSNLPTNRPVHDPRVRESIPTI